MRIAFIKCHGSGNDFPLIDARDLLLSDDDWTRIARALSDRRGPVGGDGILLLVRGDKGGAFGMRMRNPDGTEAETCLNGLRCTARLGFELLGLNEATIELGTSTVTASRDGELATGVAAICETAGPVDLDASKWIRGVVGKQVIEQAIPMLRSERAFTAVAIPNPHLLAFVDQVDESELGAIGVQCEAAPDWLPGRANVSFVEQRGSTILFVRTFERGVGLTASCGSAMAASAYAACLTGRSAFGERLSVLNAGGIVHARVEKDGMVTLSGNATFEWEGWAEIDLKRGIAGDLTITRHHNDEIAAWARLVDGLAAT